MTKIYNSILLIFISLNLFAQIDSLQFPTDTNYYYNPKTYYEVAFNEFQNMLEGKQELSFKRAVFITENAYYENFMDYSQYDNLIKYYANMCLAFKESNPLQNYPYDDYETVAKNAAVFMFMADTIWETFEKPLHLPYTYDFEDYNGVKDWSKMFVTKLLDSKKGNCHSLPFLYKIIVDEIGGQAYLSLAPNHIYIRQHSKNGGWYNTELTSGNFPIDAWIMASGYVQIDAIRSGIYMDTLDLKQSVALCLIDLAKGYERKFGSSNPDFSVKCADLALKHYPNYINAMIMKADALKSRFDVYRKLYNAEYPKDILHMETPKELFTEMEQLYVKVIQLGYREMPEKMYQEWLMSLELNKDKYINKNIIFNQIKKQ